MPSTITLRVDDKDVRRGMDAAASATQPVVASLKALQAEAKATGATLAATATAADAAAKSTGGLNNNVRMATQGVQDFLSGSAFGGLQGGLLGASNNISLLAMNFGGLAGILTSIAISALPLFVSNTAKAVDETDRLNVAIERLAQTESRRQSVSSMSSADAKKELELIAEKIDLTDQAWKAEHARLVNRQLDDGEDTTVQQAELEKKVYEDTIALAREKGRVQEQLNKAKEKEALEAFAVEAAEDQRLRLMQQSAANAQRSLGIYRQHADAVEAESKAEIEAAKHSKDPEKVANAQRKVTAEIQRSASALERLQDEFEEATDPKDADRIVQSMNDYADAIQEAKDNLKDLNDQHDRAKAAKQQSDQAKADADKKRKEEQAAQQQHHAVIESQEKAHQIRLQAILKGEDPSINTKDAAKEVVEGIDKKEIAKNIAEHRGNAARDAYLFRNRDRLEELSQVPATIYGGQGPNPDFMAAEMERRRIMAQADKQAQAAARQGFQQVMSGGRGMNPEQQAMLQNQERQAVADLAGQAVNTVAQSGKIAGNIVQALDANVKQMLNTEQEVSYLSQQVASLMQQINQANNQGNARRGRLMRGHQ